jgi:hypothetical protein
MVYTCVTYFAQSEICKHVRQRNRAFQKRSLGTMCEEELRACGQGRSHVDQEQRFPATRFSLSRLSEFLCFNLYTCFSKHIISKKKAKKHRKEGEGEGEGEEASLLVAHKSRLAPSK